MGILSTDLEKALEFLRPFTYSWLFNSNVPLDEVNPDNWQSLEQEFGDRRHADRWKLLKEALGEVNQTIGGKKLSPALARVISNKVSLSQVCEIIETARSQDIDSQLQVLIKKSNKKADDDHKDEVKLIEHIEKYLASKNFKRSLPGLNGVDRPLPELEKKIQDSAHEFIQDLQLVLPLLRREKLGPGNPARKSRPWIRTAREKFTDLRISKEVQSKLLKASGLEPF